MNFLDQITEDIKAAMKARDHGKLEALRGIKKELLEAKTAKGASAELAEADIMKVLQKMVKQRKDTAALYVEQGRQDLAEIEQNEASVIAQYLPAEMSAEELQKTIAEIIAEVGATSPKDMGSHLFWEAGRNGAKHHYGPVARPRRGAPGYSASTTSVTRCRRKRRTCPVAGSTAST